MLQHCYPLLQLSQDCQYPLQNLAGLSLQFKQNSIACALTATPPTQFSGEQDFQMEYEGNDAVDGNRVVRIEECLEGNFAKGSGDVERWRVMLEA